MFVRGGGMGGWGLGGARRDGWRGVWWVCWLALGVKSEGMEEWGGFYCGIERLKDEIVGFERLDVDTLVIERRYCDLNIAKLMVSVINCALDLCSGDAGLELL